MREGPGSNFYLQTSYSGLGFRILVDCFYQPALLPEHYSEIGHDRTQ
jgi:hypothetical protein